MHINTRFWKAMRLANFNDPEPDADGGGLLAGGDATKPEGEAGQQEPAGHEEVKPDNQGQPDGLLASGKDALDLGPMADVDGFNIPEKFIDKESGEVNFKALAKSYEEIRAAYNRASQGKDGKAPENHEDYVKSMQDEDGKFVIPEGTDRFGEIANDDPAILGFAKAAKEAGISDKQFQALVQSTMVEWNGLLPEPLNLDEERDKLGKNAPALINANKAWVKGLLEQGQITEDLYTRAMELGRDAVGVKLMQALREQSGEIHIPTLGANSGDMPMSEKEWYGMQFDTHGKPGEDFQSFMERKTKIGESIFGTDPSGSSPAGLGVPDTSSAHLRTKRS